MQTQTRQSWKMNGDFSDWQILDVRLVLQLNEGCNAEFLHLGEAGLICEIIYMRSPLIKGKLFRMSHYRR